MTTNNDQTTKLTLQQRGWLHFARDLFVSVRNCILSLNGWMQKIEETLCLICSPNWWMSFGITTAVRHGCNYSNWPAVAQVYNWIQFVSRNACAPSKFVFRFFFIVIARRFKVFTESPIGLSCKSLDNWLSSLSLRSWTWHMVGYSPRVWPKCRKKYWQITCLSLSESINHRSSERIGQLRCFGHTDKFEVGTVNGDDDKILTWIRWDTMNFSLNLLDKSCHWIDDYRD